MRRSQSFLKTKKEAPADEQAKNAQFLIRAGYIHKESAGVYDLLPLGLKVVDNIKQVVRSEMNNIGGEELLMTSLQRKELWEKTDRWDDKKVDIWFKSKLQNGSEVGLGWSHEEPISDMMREFIASYRDLPAYVYQFQNKLRNEMRAKSGIMRSREFIMKDLYSYSKSQAEHEKFYEKVTKAYHRIFEQLGIAEDTFFTYASGGAFTKFSHEFQTLCEAGEDTIYLHRTKKLAINQEVLNKEVLEHLQLKKEELEEVKGAEVGNIFSFGTTKTEQLGLVFTTENGETRPVILGSYGIGITRLVGVLAEKFADEAGLVWPKAIAPYEVYLARVGNDNFVTNAADELYERLTEARISVLYDDRGDVHAGEMFADADLLGLPYRVVVSTKTVEAKQYELKERSSSDEPQLIDAQGLLEKLATGTTG